MSKLGSLSDCLMDNDRDVRKRARRLRLNALVLSLLLEAALIAAMLLWPLITPGVIHRDIMWTPTAPYGGGGGGAKPTHPRRDSHPRTIHDRIRSALVFSSPQIPNHPTISADFDDEPGSEGSQGCIGNCAGPGGPGLFIPGATGDEPRFPDPPHEATRIEKPVSISQGVMEASLIHRVQPVYPVIARINHISGSVVLHAIIGTDGTIQQLQVESGNSILAMAAIAAVREWRYRPTLLSGKPVEVNTYITVSFVLE